jgi:hypothetical protein
MRAVLALVVLVGTVGVACAESNGPVIVIPGRPGVPVIINGVDASYSVVEGDWGLDKGLHFQPTIYNGHPVAPAPPVGHYYPSSGHLPGYGRLEIEGADKPKPAPSFHQSWSAGSKQADPPAQLNQVPPNPPPVIEAPRFNQNSIQQNFGNVPPQFGEPRGDQRGPQRHP